MQEHSVECTRSGHQLRPRICGHQCTDQLVDRRIFQAPRIIGAFFISRFRAQHIEHIVTRTDHIGEANAGHVEIEFFHPLLYERVIGGALFYCHAEFFQIAHIDTDDAREGRLIIQNFKAKYLAFGITQRAVPIFPARFFKKCTRLQ